MSVAVCMIRSLWGMENIPTLEEKLRRVKQAGYEGVECPLPPEDPSQWIDLLSEYGLYYVGMIAATHADDFEKAVDDISQYKPIGITAHSGYDRMSFKEGCDFFLRALRAERGSGIPIAHETRRGGLFYAPWVTAQYLEEFPDLCLCADFSHWCVVCESMLESMNDLMALACERAIHIHARVGSTQRPQVPDPRVPSYMPYVERFETWWDDIRTCREGSGATRLTITTEFGPPPYMQTHPETQTPVADLDILCDWMAQRLRARWE